MASTKTQKPADEPTPDDVMDTEGQSLSMNPSASREMANVRSREIEREARERQRAKESKQKGR